MSFAPVEEQWRILSARAAEILPEEEFRAKLGLGRPLRVKLGLDPTAEHVTLGWAVVLRQLRRFQDLGHTAVLIIGDFTARVGDPSGQNRTRPMLEAGEVRSYAERVLGQFRLILREDRLEVRYNSEWLEGLGASGLLRLASRFTVAQMLQRDDFATRFQARAPISVTELLYPLLQAYDSVAVGADVELGGTDQHFNLLAGRDLQRALGHQPQVIMTMPLLEGTDGVRKMSQSLGNYVAITEPPEEMFGKLMRIPDRLMGKYFLLATELDPAEVEELERQLAAGALRPEQAKRRLAEEVVALYHGRDAAAAARAAFDRVHRDRGLPERVPEAPLPPELAHGDTVYLPKLLKALGLERSASEARHRIEEGGVRLDGERVTGLELPAAQLRGRVLQVGRRRFVRVT